MNDLNLSTNAAQGIAAPPVARPTNAAGSRSGPTRDDERPASAFDRVMERVARQDAAKAQGRQTSAPGDRSDTDDESEPRPADQATESSAPVAASPAALAIVVEQAAVPAASAPASPVAADVPGAEAAPEAAAAVATSPAAVGPRPQPGDGAFVAATHSTDLPGVSATAAARATPRAAPTTSPHAADAKATHEAVVTGAADAAIERVVESASQHLQRTGSATRVQPEPAPVAHQTASTIAAAPPPTYTLAHARIGTPVLQAGFSDDLANRVVFLAGQRVQSAEIALTPADLGPLSVTIEVRGQEAQLFFGAAHATTRAAIEDALPRLREMFAASGLHLAGAQVGEHGRRDFAAPRRGSTDPARTIAVASLASDSLHPMRPAHPDRLIDVLV